MKWLPVDITDIIGIDPHVLTAILWIIAWRGRSGKNFGRVILTRAAIFVTALWNKPFALARHMPKYRRRMFAAPITKPGGIFAAVNSFMNNDAVAPLPKCAGDRQHL